ncbi:hypothetical protein [Bacillus taeanensis]|uniref:Uncharacterized protein n=1 Tax=Bacillus taeanensis TaxID=273032 RepID=A0A366XT87_9BACI|nr:hypothetical protein [Bacillus taeanensis]RBW69107.1 hypothetical protein DS031_13190 [Bacillus taeanensis]
MSIQFDSIQINYIHANSGFFVGENTQVNWKTQYKENNALGEVIGDQNILIQNVNVVYDNDIIDTPIENISYGEEQKIDEKGKKD